MWHEGVQARMEELSGREGRRMSDLPIHPSALELSCKKPERLKKRRMIDRKMYNKVKNHMKQKISIQREMQTLIEGVQRGVLKYSDFYTMTSAKLGAGRFLLEWPGNMMIEWKVACVCQRCNF